MDAGAYYIILALAGLAQIATVFEEYLRERPAVVLPAIAAIFWVVVAYWSSHIVHVSAGSQIVTQATGLMMPAAAMFVLNAVIFLLRIIGFFTYA